jgi:hypothetical protein
MPQEMPDSLRLLARSRHASVRSLERYARPGPEAVAAHVAASDPAARGPAGSQPKLSYAALRLALGDRARS